MNYGETIVYDTSSYKDATESEVLTQTRENFNKAMLPIGHPKVSLIVVGYNRIEKTKACIESLLKYTQDVDYELILCDNGSDDGTLEYFEGIAHPKKIVMRVTENHGATLPSATSFSLTSGEFVCFVANDLFLTPRWLSNMLICMESDVSIGIVNPMSTNVSNAQKPRNINFSTADEFLRTAERFNVSDNTKWQEKLRVITIGTLYRKSAFELTGVFDSAFVHSFSEDDFCLRMRRSGYKIILCGDVIIHHDHDVQHLPFEQAIKYNTDIKIGKDIFKNKYIDLDAWNDVLILETEMINLLPRPKEKNPTVLAIDVRMGSPLLELRNFLRRNNVLNINSFAFTTKAKYYADLQTICKENVICDRIEFIDGYFEENSLDYILIGEDINDYLIAKELLECLFTLLRDGGFLLYKYKKDDEFKYEMIKK